MDPNSLLLWTVLVSSVLVLARGASGAMSPLRTALVVGLVLLAIALSATIPDRAGYLAGSAWFVLLVLPGLGLGIVNRLLAGRRFRSAHFLARMLAWVHPFDGFRQYPRLVVALEHLRSGRFAEGRRALAELANVPSQSGWTARVLLTRLTGDWEGLVEWVDANSQRKRLLHEPMLAEGYLQGLGELQRHQKLFEQFERISRGRGLPSSVLNAVRLKTAAFAGDTKTVEAIENGPLSDLPVDVKRFWKATSQQASGLWGPAETTLIGLTASTDPRISNSAMRRLASPAQPPGELLEDDRFRRLLDDVRHAVTHEERFSTFASTRTGRTWATWTAAAALLAVFAFEVPGGPTDVDNLVRLGALVIPPSAPSGGWWRVFTAVFLHAGPLHLFLNLAGLVLFGSRLERVWGHLAMSLTFLASAIGSSALVALFSFSASGEDAIVMVGASGGVMGLIGAVLGYQLRGLMIRRNLLIRREFLLLVMLILLQMLFDATTPNVSSSCHLLGLGLGVVIGSVMGSRIQSRLRKSAALEATIDRDSSPRAAAAV